MKSIHQKHESLSKNTVHYCKAPSRCRHLWPRPDATCDASMGQPARPNANSTLTPTTGSSRKVAAGLSRSGTFAKCSTFLPRPSAGSVPGRFIRRVSLLEPALRLPLSGSFIFLFVKPLSPSAAASAPKSRPWLTVCANVSTNVRAKPLRTGSEKGATWHISSPGKGAWCERRRLRLCASVRRRVNAHLRQLLRCQATTASPRGRFCAHIKLKKGTR